MRSSGAVAHMTDDDRLADCLSLSLTLPRPLRIPPPSCSCTAMRRRRWRMLLQRHSPCSSPMHSCNHSDNKSEWRLRLQPCSSSSSSSGRSRSRASHSRASHSRSHSLNSSVHPFLRSLLQAQPCHTHTQASSSSRCGTSRSQRISSNNRSSSDLRLPLSPALTAARQLGSSSSSLLHQLHNSTAHLLTSSRLLQLRSRRRASHRRLIPLALSRHNDRFRRNKCSKQVVSSSSQNFLLAACLQRR